MKRGIHFFCIASLIWSTTFPAHAQSINSCVSLFQEVDTAVKIQPTPAEIQQNLIDSVPPKFSKAKQLLRGIFTFPIPVIPLYNSIRDYNKRFFIFVESPTISMLSSAVGVQLARFFSPGTNSWMGNFLDSFIPFTIVSTVRNGIGLESQYTAKQKYWMGYLYSVGFYSLVSILTSGTMTQIPDVLMNLSGASVEQLTKTSYAMGLVGFAFAWPLLTSKLQTDIIPNYLFGRFLQFDELNIIKNKNQSPDEKLRLFKDKLEKAEALLAEINPNSSKKDVRNAEMGYRGALHRYYWAKWRLKGLEAGDTNPLNGKPVISNKSALSSPAYWFLKSAVTMGVSVSIIVPYFIARNLTVGTGIEDIGLITEQIMNALMMVKDSQISEIGSQILTVTPPEILQEYGLTHLN